jgi:hypothetical protein
MNYIVTTYLTTAPDPQLRFIDGKWVKNTIKAKDDINYVIDWYYWICQLEMNGIILHDGLSEDFMGYFPGVKFIKTHPVPAGIQLYDYRWFLALNCFAKLEIDNVFFTDVSDVKVKMNPFVHPYFKEGVLYCGDVAEEGTPKLLKDDAWVGISLMNKTLVKLPLFYDIINSNNPVLNCGTFGGNREIVLTFLKRFVSIIQKVANRPIDINGDIPLFNYVMYRDFPTQFHCGYPVNSVFKAYEDRNDVWFIHK